MNTRIAAIFSLTLVASAAWGAVTVEVNVSADRSSAATTIQSPVFSTSTPNELLLAFVAADYISGTNTTVSGISGAGLSWQRVVRTNVQSGTAEIWRAFATSPVSSTSVTASLSNSVISSITVMTFTGVDTSGVNGSTAVGASVSANSSRGAPTASLITTGNGSLVVAVGNDYDNAISRTLGPNQVLIHQALTPAGDTYWVQMLTSPVPLSGTTVTVNDTAPATDRYNLSLVEIVAAPAGVSGYRVTGSITPANLGSGSSISLTTGGSTVGTATADAGGGFTFNNVANGTYQLSASKSGVTFNPSAESITVNGSDVAASAFTATQQTWSISGLTNPPLSGATVTLTGSSGGITTTDATGAYSFTGLANGTYSVTPSDAGYAFNPSSQTVNLNGADQVGVSFSQSRTWAISGTVTPGTSGITVTLSGAASATASTDAQGNYSLTGLVNGTYTITPNASGLTFSPSSLVATVNGADVSGENFTAQNSGSAALAIDARISADTSAAATTISTPSFSTRYSNELLLAFISTDYISGTNTTVTGVSSGGLSWTLVKRTNAQKGSSEIWKAFSVNPQSSVAVSATLSQKVISSITVLSFTGADPSGSGAGAIGATASASAASGAPTGTITSTRPGSWVFGVGNDFDNAIVRSPGTGQSLVHQTLTSTGDTYWVQMQNGVTPLTGTLVSINDPSPTADRYNLAVVEVLPGSGSVVSNPPVVKMLAPPGGTTVASLVTVAADATSQSSGIASLQFILDGTNLGAQLTVAPYSLTWDTTKVAAGTHTLMATAFDSGGQSTTSSPISITVDNSGNPLVVGSWSAPVTLGAVAVNLALLKNNKLLFYDDGSSPTVWDYTTNSFTSTPVNVDLFCSGHASLADGRLLVVGGYGSGSGSIGIASSEIFDPSQNTWTVTPSMTYKRWYPTATTLSDGRILVTAGWQTSNHTNAGIPEIYDPAANSWTQLTNANNPFETYPFIFLLPDGRVIHVGGSEYATITDALDLTSQTWSVVDGRILDGGSATMYLPNKILKSGSATDSQNSGPSSNTSFVLDLGQPSPAWQQVPSMAYPRSFLNLTELPDGSVLATGGESDKNGGNISNAVYAAELWSPTTQTWSTMASMHTPREYHSTALLLPDGRVVQSGMGADFGNVPDEQSAEFYSPPYLFKGARPAISQAPSLVHYGTNFTISTPDAASLAKVVLIRLGAVTHFFDQNSRYVPLTMQVGSGSLTLTAPANGNVAPPGYYMLFIVNSNGVPSIAPIVQVGP